MHPPIYSVLRINGEKFTENFVRRFAEQVNINKHYKVTFYDIYEEPPYAVVSVTAYGNGSDLLFTDNDGAKQVTNRLAGALYTTGEYTTFALDGKGEY